MWIPRDDHSIWVYLYAWDADKPFPDRVRELYRQGTTGIPRMVLGTHEPFATLQNDYTIDRQLQKTGNYTGIVNGREQDMAVVDSMGPIMDRSKERLGTSDMAIILARRMLLRMARDLQNGKEPYAASHGDAYCIRSLDVVDESPDFGAVLQKYDSDVHKPKAIYAGAR